MDDPGVSDREERRPARWILAALVLALAVAAGVGLARLLAPEPEFIGTELEPPRPAMDFSLLDQNRRPFRLSEQRGHVVVLTFLYTSCTDVCPFIGAKLRRAREQLGPADSQIEIVVITTDPGRDDGDRALRYSRALGMSDRWHFLTGTEAELEPVWEAYLIRPARADRAEHVSDDVLREYGLFSGLSEQEITGAKAAIDQFGGGYEVIHSTPVWLIDPSGQLRAFQGQDLLPSELVHDIELLLEAR